MSVAPPRATAMRATWKPMTPAHLDQVLSVADRVHLDYPEDRSVFVERLALFPEGCFVAESPSQVGVLVGYAVAHPGILMQPPPLNSLLGALPESPSCLYLHDVALLGSARGLGLGRVLVQRFKGLALARKLGPLALTAVNASVRYWHGHGFDIVDPTPALAVKLASYGEDAAYMICD